MLRFNNAPIDNLRLIRDPQFWDILDRGVQNSNQLQIDFQRNDGETLCFALYQRQGLGDGSMNINLGAWEVEEMRMLFGMRNGEEAYLEPQAF